MRTWQNCGLKLKKTPAKSSLSEVRKKVSYEFFEDVFRNDLREHESNRKTFKGFHIYAIDGDQLDLPRSSDVVSYDFVGYPSSLARETHYPKMYTTQALDVLSGEVREFHFSNRQDEIHLARGIVKSLETNSISIYDRLHCRYDTFLSHHEAGSFFIVRARNTVSSKTEGKGVGVGVHVGVREFTKSHSRSRMITWRAKPGERKKKPIDLQVRLVKIRNPKTKKNYVFCTNLPEDKISNQLIGELYRKRWEIETSFRDLTCTLKMSQFHSKKMNGILQEIFALLWLANSVKRQMNANLKSTSNACVSEKDYRKSNFKLTIDCVMDSIGFLVRNKWRKFLEIVNYLIQRTIENRTRDSRSYERCVKHRGREYKQRNLVPRESRLTERH